MTTVEVNTQSNPGHFQTLIAPRLSTFPAGRPLPTIRAPSQSWRGLMTTNTLSCRCCMEPWQRMSHLSEFCSPGLADFLPCAGMCVCVCVCAYGHKLWPRFHNFLVSKKNANNREKDTLANRILTLKLFYLTFNFMILYMQNPPRPNISNLAKRIMVLDITAAD